MGPLPMWTTSCRWVGGHGCWEHMVVVRVWCPSVGVGHWSQLGRPGAGGAWAGVAGARYWLGRSKDTIPLCGGYRRKQRARKYRAMQAVCMPHTQANGAHTPYGFLNLLTSSQLVRQIVPYHMTHNAEPEAVDLLLEVGVGAPVASGSYASYQSIWLLEGWKQAWRAG